MMYALSTKVNIQSIMMGHITREYRSTQATVAEYMYITAKYGSILYTGGLVSNLSSAELGLSIWNDGFTAKNNTALGFDGYSRALDIATQRHPVINAINFTISETVNNLPWEKQ